MGRKVQPVAEPHTRRASHRDRCRKRHGVSVDAALILLGALAQGNGRQAQFNHPDLGGMGQWSQGGMIMVGDMFNQGLKYRVDALCDELAGLLRSQPLVKAEGGRFSRKVRAAAGESVCSWRGPSRPASGGLWNWAVPPPPAPRMNCDTLFPGSRRLAIQQGGHVRVYDCSFSWNRVKIWGPVSRFIDTPARHRRAVEHQSVLEELLAAEQLIIRVLDPALAQNLVGEVVHMLEDRQPCR